MAFPNGELECLRAENAMLRSLLEAHGIGIPEESADTETDESPQDVSENPQVSKRSPTADKIALFMSLFHGRPDVYARRCGSTRGSPSNPMIACSPIRTRCPRVDLET